MSTKSFLHQAKLNEWISRFADQKASGLTVTEWCKQNSLSEYKYFYWKRMLKEEAIEQALPEATLNLLVKVVQVARVGKSSIISTC